MGFRLKVDGAESVSLSERCIKDIQFINEIPEDSNARATDNGVGMKIWGKMLFSLGATTEDSTLNLAKWSQIPSESATCYRKVEAEVVSAGQIVRSYTLPNAFVVEYREELDDETGVGEFYLHVKQKKDVTSSVTVEGGFSN